MNSPQLGLRVASVLSALIALAHGLRLVALTDVTIAAHPVGLWPSAVAAVAAAALAAWFWRLAALLGKSTAPSP